MPDWRATRPVDVARLNNSVFLAVLRMFGVAYAIIVPTYLILAVVIGHRHFPSLTAGHILAVAFVLVLTGLVGHLLLGLLAVQFIVAVGSLIWWRHVLAIGGPSAALAAFASATRRVVVRLAHRVDSGLLAVLARREHTTHVVPEHTLLDQLRAALLVAPAAPPLQLALLADRTVRTDQLISRRTA